MLGEALFLGAIFPTLNASDGSTVLLTPSASVQTPQTFPVLPALRRGRKLNSWHMIRRKRLKTVGTARCFWSKGRSWKRWELRMLLLGMIHLVQLPRSCYPEVILKSSQKCRSLPPKRYRSHEDFRWQKLLWLLKDTGLLVVSELAQMPKCEKALRFSFSDSKTWTNFRKIHCILNL